MINSGFVSATVANLGFRVTMGLLTKNMDSLGRLPDKLGSTLEYET